MSNELLDIRQVRIVNDECLEVVHQNLKENQPDNGRVNIFIAAFTTCHARLKLYEYGITLNVRSSRQLNYDVMRDNLIDEIQDPQDERRDVPVSGQIFKRDPNTKDIHIVQLVKRYGLVFDKRVVDPASFKSYPYGYTPTLDDMI